MLAKIGKRSSDERLISISITQVEINCQVNLLSVSDVLHMLHVKTRVRLEAARQILALEGI